MRIQVRHWEEFPSQQGPMEGRGPLGDPGGWRTAVLQDLGGKGKSFCSGQHQLAQSGPGVCLGVKKEEAV